MRNENAVNWKRSTGAAADSNQMVGCYRLDWIAEELRLHRRITLDCIGLQQSKAWQPVEL